MTFTRHLCGLALVGATLIGAACASDSESSSTSTPQTSGSETTSGAETTAGSDTTVGAATSSPIADGGFSVAASLRQIPSAVRGGDDSGEVQIAIGDLDAATQAAGIERPPAGSTDVDALQNWLLTIDNPRHNGNQPTVAALLPEAVHSESSAEVADFVDEVGWSIGDVQSFVEYQVPPNVFTVMTGQFDADALTKAMGEPTEEIWRLGGDDFSIDPAQISAARPLGESLRELWQR